MVANKYPKPGLELRYWCVTRKDLYMLNRFFADRFGVERAEIFIETEKGNNKVYQSFQEFEEDIEVLLSLADTVQKIAMIHWEIDPAEPLNRKYLWLSVDFVYSSARFNAFATDMDGRNRAWLEDSHKEMERMFALFDPSEAFREVLRRDFLRTYPERRREGNGVVVFDYDGNIKNRIFTELSSPPAEPPRRDPGIWMRWVRNREIWVAIIVTAAVSILLILALW